MEQGQWAKNTIKWTQIKLGIKYCGTWNLELFTSFFKILVHCILCALHFPSFS